MYAFDNPTHQRSFRFFADWFDTGLGGDYSYMDWGVLLTATQPLWSYRSIGAVQILNGFTEPFSNRGVPNQGQFSLGGSRSIRGVGAEDKIGRNILLIGRSGDKTSFRAGLEPARFSRRAPASSACLSTAGASRDRRVAFTT